MFDSGITASELINELKTEVDIAIEIPNSSYLSWLNSLQQLLYSEIIQEQRAYAEGYLLGTNTYFGVGYMKTPEVKIGENAVRYEDIHAVYADETQLIESTLASGTIFPNTYWKIDTDTIGCNLAAKANEIRIIYFVKPELIDEPNYAMKNVMVPVEFIDLVKAKLRGEAYKLANEDVLAAKWLNDYNILLENFKAWIAAKKPNFGL